MSYADRYGSRRGIFRHVVARAGGLFGAYSRLKEIRWEDITRLVFVCKGNICRSPYAAVRTGLLGLQSASFGLDTTDGAPADRRAQAAAARRGCDLSDHRARRFQTAELSRGDLLLLFEPEHVASVSGNAVSASAQVSLLGLWAPELRPYLCDPYGKSDAYFDACFGIIDDALDTLAPRIRKER